MPLTRSQKLNLDKKKEDKSDDISKNPAQKEKTKKYFKWKTSEKLVLLDSMIRLKPVGQFGKLIIIKYYIILPLF